MPGRTGAYDADLAVILRWRASLVLTMTTEDELAYRGASALGEDLLLADVTWKHLPIPDFDAPPSNTAALWPEASGLAHSILQEGGRVFAHCYGGCGRAGMALLRLMVEAGEDADPALARLREARPCAVETVEQRAWASIPMYERLGWSP
ncbi:MAG: protein phosphatase [Pseudomonadota bacterium]